MTITKMNNCQLYISRGNSGRYEQPRQPIEQPQGFGNYYSKRCGESNVQSRR